MEDKAAKRLVRAAKSLKQMVPYRINFKGGKVRDHHFEVYSSDRTRVVGEIKETDIFFVTGDYVEILFVNEVMIPVICASKQVIGFMRVMRDPLAPTMKITFEEEVGYDHE